MATAIGRGSTDLILYTLQEAGKNNPLSNKEIALKTGMTPSLVGKVLYTQRHKKVGATVEALTDDAGVVVHTYIGERVIPKPETDVVTKAPATKAKKTAATKTAATARPKSKAKTKTAKKKSTAAVRPTTQDFTSDDLKSVIDEFSDGRPKDITRLVLSTKLIEPKVTSILDILASKGFVSTKSIMGENVYLAADNIKNAAAEITIKSAPIQTLNPQDLLFLLEGTPATVKDLKEVLVVYTEDEILAAITDLVAQGKVASSPGKNPEYSIPKATPTKQAAKPKKSSTPMPKKPRAQTPTPIVPVQAELTPAKKQVTGTQNIAELMRNAADYIEQLENENAVLVDILKNVQSNIASKLEKVV